MIAQFSQGVLEFFNIVVLSYFVLLNTVYLFTSLVAFQALKKYARRLKSLDIRELIASAGAPPITIVVPAFDEEMTCVHSTESLLALNYPQYEIIFVNDGSSDRTVERMREAFDLKPAARLPTANLPTAAVRGIYRSRQYPNLWVVDKDNGGKSDALNAGVNICVTPFFCAMDADTLLEREALTRIIRPFLEDGSTVAAGGIIRIVNGCTVRNGVVTNVRLSTNYLARLQVLEYLRAFLAGRMGWSALDATLIISGAFGLFRRSVVVDAGGFASEKTTGRTVGEDMELVVRLHRHCRQNHIPYRITFIPDPVAWTECPERFGPLGRQRDRWQRGLAESLSRHIRMLFNPRYGKVGFMAFPHFFFLELFGPVVEFTGYIVFALTVVLGMASTLYVLAFFMVAYIFGTALSIAAVSLEELTFRRYPRYSDLLRLFWLAMLEHIGFRQLLAYWRVRGVVSSWRRRKGWGEMKRRGFAVESGPSSVGNRL